MGKCVGVWGSREDVGRGLKKCWGGVEKCVGVWGDVDRGVGVWRSVGVWGVRGDV